MIPLDKFIGGVKVAFEIIFEKFPRIRACKNFGDILEPSRVARKIAFIFAFLQLRKRWNIILLELRTKDQIHTDFK